MKMVQHINISFFINHQPIQLSIAPGTTALALLREQLGLTGAKETCSEGDCGSCTIAVGSWEGDRFVYRAKTACILLAAQLHGKHVMTVEGLADGEKLHLIQDMMLHHHAIQCGYCTPGMVMSLFCLFANNPQPTQEDILFALEGNLCRCTGYIAIYDAAEAVAEQLHRHADKWRTHIFPSYMDTIPDQLRIPTVPTNAEQTQTTLDNVTQSYHAPTSLEALFDLMEQYAEQYTLLAGGTDVLVSVHLRDDHPRHIIDLAYIPELQHITERNGHLFIGACTPVTQVIEHDAVQKGLEPLVSALRIMGSAQSRNMATLGGNIATAAPVADGTCAMLGLKSIVHLVSKSGARTVPLSEFFTGYHQTVLKPGEVITEVEIPELTGCCTFDREYCGFEKATKRRAVAISKVCSCVHVELDDRYVVQDCCIAFGGAQAYPTLAEKTMQALQGTVLTEAIIPDIAEQVYAEFEAYVSQRSESEYRRQVIINQMLKHLRMLLQVKENENA